MSFLMLTFLVVYFSDETKTSADTWGMFAIAILGGIFWVLMEMDFHFRKLTLETENCSYTNMFGKKREFTLNDIHGIYPKINLQEAGYALVDKDGEYIAKIEKNMLNVDQLIPFLERQKNAGRWSGNILKEYEVSSKSKPMNTGEKKGAPVSKESMPETLVVKPNKLYLMPLWIVLSVCVGLIGYIFYHITLGISGNSETIAGIIMAGLGLVICFIIILVERMTLIPAYKNICLHMSLDVCEMTESNGYKIKFHLDDIEDINKVIHGSGKNRRMYLHIKLKDGRDDITLRYDMDMSNVKNIQEFVAYHKEKKEELSQ